MGLENQEPLLAGGLARGVMEQADKCLVEATSHVSQLSIPCSVWCSPPLALFQPIAQGLATLRSSPRPHGAGDCESCHVTPHGSSLPKQVPACRPEHCILG